MITNPYIIPGDDFQHSHKRLCKAHLDHVVPIEQWHPQFPVDPEQPRHVSRTQKRRPHCTIGSYFSHLKNNDNDNDEDNGTKIMMENEERTETQENVKFHFQAPPKLVQKIPRQLSTLSTIKLFPEPKIRIFKNFVQRRWV